MASDAKFAFGAINNRQGRLKREQAMKKNSRRILHKNSTGTRHKYRKGYRQVKKEEPATLAY